MIVANINQFAKALNEGTKSLLGRAGDAIGSACTEAFEELVRETPQWTGETAASWSMGFLPGENQRMHVEKKPKLEDALYRGMQPAVNLAMVEGLATMSRNNLEDYLRKDIILTNPSEQLGAAVVGAPHLREINKPGANIEKFKATVIAELKKHV